ncbi:pyrroline-5-carboxylate reductase [Helicobacter salomonis]|uniref:pyrroline-5-carboxylate reductase n=1 Tax=Helicobacter salomonis TaxID=56878 RepID=UPI001F473E81|nr:pyrroline-5-carboxylate reductase [Helicobacter salomonis]
MKTRLLIVGYGRMAQAMLRGFAQNAHKLESYQIQITGRNPNKVHDFLKSLPLEMETLPPSHTLDIDNANVLLAVKPYALGNFSYKGRACMVLSVLAGVGVDTLKEHLESSVYVRCMPNIAAQHHLSATSMYVDFSCLLKMPHESEHIKQQAHTLLECLGSVVEVAQENLIDASLATSGSSLAFLSMVAQALVSAGVREGLSVDQASSLVKQSFKGFAKLLEEQSPQEIIDSICTPGGATITGLSVLEEKAFKGILMQACHAAVRKGRTKSKSEE